MNTVFRMLAKPAKLAKVVTYGLCELRGLGVRNTTKQFQDLRKKVRPSTGSGRTGRRNANIIVRSW